jgi:hypothetical protein
MAKLYSITGDCCIIDDILDEESFMEIGNGDFAALFDVHLVKRHPDPDDEQWNLDVEVADKDENEFLAWCLKYHVDVALTNEEIEE